MVPLDFLFSLIMLCYCVLHVLKHFLHWNCCVEDMWSHLQLLKFEGCIARKLRFHIFNSSNLTKTSFSHLQLFEFEGSIARKLRFIHHGCHLNVKICTKHCVFSGKRIFKCGGSHARGVRRRRAYFEMLAQWN